MEMGIFDGVLLASDYDGTLRGSTLKVLDRDKEANRYFQDQGGAFVLTTGRSYAAFYRQARELPLDYPTLLSNGATFCEMDTGKTIFTHNLPLRATGDMAEVAASYPNVACETYYGEEIYCFQPNEHTQDHMKLVESSYIECPPEQMPTPWLKVLLEGERQDLAEIQKLILSRWGDFYECIFSSVNLLELTGKNVHKGAGVLEAAKHLGVAPEHVYCVGDNDNDLPMLRTARIGFAPEGSVAASRGERLEIVRDADHGCVENVIEILKERYQNR